LTNYYDLTSFRNTIYTLNIALETYLSNQLFKNDATRIVYSSSEFAFRKRTQELSKLGNGTNLNNLDLPFLNYKITGIDRSVSRQWWNKPIVNRGLFIDELGFKVKCLPVKISYDSTIYFHRDDDLLYAYNQLLWDDGDETKINFSLMVEGVELGFFSLYMLDNMSYEPTYNETEWLTRNKIHTASLNFTCETVIIKDNLLNFGIPEKVILDFMVMHEVNNDISNEERLEFIVDRFNEEVIGTV